MGKEIGVFVVDDHPLVREGLVSIIEGFHGIIELVGVAGNGMEALNRISTLSRRPDVILMDINMPQMCGVECTRKLKKLYSEIKIVVLSMYNQSLHIKQMLKEGVYGYVLKDCDKEELKEAILEVFSGKTYFGKGVAHQVMMEYSSLKRGSKMEIFNSLSPREKEVLQLIIKDKSNQEIADELYISIRTVETHKQNLIVKTGVKSVAGLVVLALKENFIEEFNSASS